MTATGPGFQVLLWVESALSIEQNIVISKRGREKVNDEFSYVCLLPLLEKPFETAALDLPDAVRTLSKKYRLTTEVTLQPLVVTALASHSEYWAGLALQWLEDGFPLDLELTVLLAHCSENQTLSQAHRHRARRLAYRKDQGAAPHA